MENSFLKKLIIGLCAVLTLVGAAYLVFNGISMYKNRNAEKVDEYKGYTERFPLDNVSIMIPDEFEIVSAKDVNMLPSGESLVTPYDEYYTWETSSYVGMVSVSKEQNSMTPQAYMDACAIPTYQEYYADLGIEIISRQAGTIADYDAAALTFKYTVGYEMGVTKTFMAYSTYIQNNGYIYTTTFVCEEWDYQTQKEIFDKIATSIKIGVSKPIDTES